MIFRRLEGLNSLRVSVGNTGFVVQGIEGLQVCHLSKVGLLTLLDPTIESCVLSIGLDHAVCINIY